VCSAEIAMNADDKENGTAQACEGSTKWTIHGKHKFTPLESQPFYAEMHFLQSKFG
jgi:hypothetical protein